MTFHQHIPEHGLIKTERFFALIPVTYGTETRWLEMVEVDSMCCVIAEVSGLQSMSGDKYVWTELGFTGSDYCKEQTNFYKSCYEVGGRQSIRRCNA